MTLRTVLPLLTLCVLVVPARAAGPIKDPNLEAAVRGVLHFPTGDLTDEKLKGVFVLKENTKGKGIKDLSGLEKCPNLAELCVLLGESQFDTDEMAQLLSELETVSEDQARALLLTN